MAGKKKAVKAKVAEQTNRDKLRSLVEAMQDELDSKREELENELYAAQFAIDEIDIQLGDLDDILVAIDRLT